ncbi:MAG: UvrD-helicase domain-containing protein, partial [Clostridia bacterium]|nr:UvrD-helicase domain-containing protein [Clostridia bacterium]
MGETKWTASQQNVIDSEGGTLLVSAAAGSGKTTVMVEKITRMILEGKCSVRDILVVTFTNAAAANMKAKIAKSLAKAARENRENKNLVSELNCLPLARISTIDSLCIDLVRSNFHALDIEPDFALMDGGKEKILRNEAINSVLDEYYEKNPENFSLLCDTISGDRDDNNLIEAALNIYDEAQSHPFPDEYLDSLTGSYTDTRPFFETTMGKILLAYLKKAFDYYIAVIEKAVAIAENEELPGQEKQKAELIDMFNKEKSDYCSIRDSLKTDDWDTVRGKILSVKFETLITIRNKSPEMEFCTDMRKKWKKPFTDTLR